MEHPMKKNFLFALLSIGLLGGVAKASHFGNPVKSTRGGTGSAAQTSGRALETDGSSRIVSSSVTSTELGRLSGVTASVQTQINGVSAQVAVNSSAIQSITTNIAGLQGATSNFLKKTGDTQTGKFAVINSLNGGLEISTPSGSAGFLVSRTGSSAGSFYLGTAGDRDGSSTYDELQFRKGNGTSTAFTMRGYDSGVQQLLFGTSDDAYISRTGSGELGFYTAGGLRGGFYSDGTFRLFGGTSGYVGFQASSSTTSYNLTIPAAQGSSGETLVNNGSGTLSWQPLTGSTPTRQIFTSGSQLYTTPANVRYIIVRMVGAGGGGGPSANVTVGAAGGNTTFGTSLLTANGGGGGGYGVTGPAGGSVTVNSPAIDLGSTAGSSGDHGENLLLTDYTHGGMGGTSCFGGAGSGGGANSNGVSAQSNSGSGGGGAGGAGPGLSGAGGAAGGCVWAQINSPSATYPAVVGAFGAGASGAGSGGAGKIIVVEYY